MYISIVAIYIYMFMYIFIKYLFLARHSDLNFISWPTAILILVSIIITYELEFMTSRV